LKEYHLYDDLVRLNNDDYYQITFDTPDTFDFFSKILSFQDLKTHSQTAKIFFFNLRHTSDKNVYMMLKWLIVVHRLIHSVSYLKILEEISESLSRMNVPILNQKIDCYIYQQLVKPYAQYLKKLCMLAIRSEPQYILCNK
jgi:hypothetical protein